MCYVHSSSNFSLFAHSEETLLYLEEIIILAHEYVI